MVEFVHYLHTYKCFSISLYIYLYPVPIQQLQSYSLGQLKELWDEITDQTAVRIGCIKVLDAQLNAVEQDRIKLVSLTCLWLDNKIILWHLVTIWTQPSGFPSLCCAVLYLWAETHVTSLTY